MGIAAYNRGSAAIARAADLVALEVRNTLDARAALWADLARAGRVLTFHYKSRTITFGPYQSAVGPSEFAVIEHGGRHRECRAYSARAASQVLVSWVGRIRPVSIN